ncbi:MAG: amidohydrolase family protein [Patescibacteria group bacterium]
MNILTEKDLQDWLNKLSWEEVEKKVKEHGHVLLPAMIDSHVHFRVPGDSHKEDWEWGSKAALEGGIVGVIDMPNNKPSITNKGVLEEKIRIVNKQKQDGFKSFFNLGASASHDPDLSCVDQVVGLKVYHTETTGDLLVQDQERLEKIYETWPKTIIVHSEEIDTILELVKKYKKPTYFCHVSTKPEIEKLQKAKQEGLPVFIEVTPHHLLLNQDDLDEWGCFLHVKPPLKTKEDNKALWKAVRDGTVDVLASDHAPHLPEEKEGDNPPAGLPGVGQILPLMLNAVNENKLKLERLIELMHNNPIKIFGLTGLEGCGVAVDMKQDNIIEKKGLNTKCGWSPYEGRKLFGWPEFTILDKKVVKIEREDLDINLNN